MIRWSDKRDPFRRLIRGPFGRAKILVILGIGYLLYPFGTDNFYLGRSRRILTPIPLWTEDKKHYVCLRCVEQRMEHPHFMNNVVEGGIGET